jgi:hypothetical protein
MRWLEPAVMAGIAVGATGWFRWRLGFWPWARHAIVSVEPVLPRTSVMSAGLPPERLREMLRGTPITAEMEERRRKALREVANAAKAFDTRATSSNVPGCDCDGCRLNAALAALEETGWTYEAK